MTNRNKVLVGFAAAALVLTGCSTGSDTSSDTSSEDTGDTSAGTTSAADMRIDVVTHGAPGDSFWDVVKSGA